LEREIQEHEAELTENDKCKLRTAFHTFRRLDGKYASLEKLANEVAEMEGTNNEDLPIKETELEQMQIRLQLAVTSAGEIWNSAYAVLQVSIANKEAEGKRAEAGGQRGRESRRRVEA
jgi:hypothetical protein